MPEALNGIYNCVSRYFVLKLAIMETYMVAKNDNSCVGYLNDAVKQIVTALIAKGDKREEAGITTIADFAGFLVCTALTQKKASQGCNSCPSSHHY